MLEATILVLIASGLWVMASHIKKQPQTAIPLEDSLERRALSTIAEGGLYCLYAPNTSARMRAFSDLHLVEGGFTLSDNMSSQRHLIDFSTIQWVSAVSIPQDGIAEITLHMEAQHHWRILTVQVPEGDMSVFIKILRQIVAQSRLNIGHSPTKPIGPIPANIAEDTLQGVSQLGAEVSLYLLPHMLIVLRGDIVQAKLDTSSIRRVLSVERMSSRLDSLLQSNTPDGVVRLYSLYETVAFALPQYRELAEEIAYLSRCPVEFITQEDKTGK